ncbi:MAG: SurA N-terminal domain-containing protein, partial [Bacteroidales bacterium]|nr:SurA N-terminal domain-containing protein [Bacteroidales bacterium]
SIRNHPVWLTTVLGGGLVLMIIMFGFDDYSGLFNGGRDTVLSINGNAVKHADYEMARQQKADFLKATQGMDASNAEANHYVNNLTYSEFVHDEIFAPAYENAAISVSPYELGQLTSGQYLSPIMTSLFGQQASQYGVMFAQMEANGFDDMNAKNMWDELKRQIILANKNQKLNSLLAAAIQPNKLEAEDAFNNENSEVAFDYVALNSYSVADSLVAISANDIKNFYNSHKDQFYLSNGDIREASYIAVELRPSDDDRNNALSTIQKNAEQFALGIDVKDLVNSTGVFDYMDVNLNNNIFRGELKEFVENNGVGDVSEPKLYNGDILNLIGSQSGKNETLNEYYYTARIMNKVNAPDSVKLVFVPAPTDKLDSLTQVVKKGDMDAQAVWVTEAATVGLEESIVAKMFDGTKNAQNFFTQELNGTNVIVKVLERTANVAKTKVAIYAERVSTSSKTRAIAYAGLNEVINKFETIKEMQDSAISNGFRMIPTTVTANSYQIGQVEEAREAVRFVFDAQNGEISKIFECGDHLILLAVTGDVQKGYRSIENKNTIMDIERMLRGEKNAEYLVNNKFAGVTDKSSLESYAEALGSEVRNASRVSLSTPFVSGLGNEPAIVGEALKAQEGAIVGPIAGQNCAAVIKVTSKKNKELNYDEAAYTAKAQNSANAYRNAGNLASKVLTLQSVIEDNRLRFY